jgi:hypothetical protein
MFDYFLLVFLRYVDDNVIFAGFHNGWLDMPSEVRIDIGNNPYLPHASVIIVRCDMISLLDNQLYLVRGGMLDIRLGKKKRDNFDD